jgi:hypothetical protein
MGDQCRRTVSYARGQLVSVSPSSTRVNPVITSRNTFLVFQRLPTTSPGSASRVSQTVSYHVPRPFSRCSFFPATDLLCPSAAEIIPASAEPELVLLTGFPCLGKSSFYRRHFAPVGYVHVNQDTLGTRPKCLKAAGEALKAGKSCVIGTPVAPPSLSGYERRRQTTPIGIPRRESFMWI